MFFADKKKTPEPVRFQGFETYWRKSALGELGCATCGLQTGILSGQQAFEAIKKMSGVTWKEKEWNNNKYLTAKEAKYGGLEVMLITRSNNIQITGHEWNSSAWLNSSNQYVDVNGNVVSAPYDSNGKMVTSTGYGYEARQLVKRIMDIIYNTDADLQSAYKAFQEVFAEEVYEFPTTTKPSAYRWVGGRDLSVYFTKNYSYVINIGEANDIETYNKAIAIQKINARQDNQIYYAGSREAAVIAYELNRW